MSPLLKRFLLIVLTPVLIIMILIMAILTVRENALVSFMEDNLSSMLTSSWILLKNNYYVTAQNESRFLLRDRALLKAIKKKKPLEDIATPTFNRLSSSNIIDHLYIYNLDNKLIYSSDNNPSEGYFKIVREVTNKNKPKQNTIYNSELKTIELIYSFPLYYRGKLKAVAQYSKNIEFLLEELSTISGYNYGFTIDGNLLYKNWEFNSKEELLKKNQISFEDKHFVIVNTNISNIDNINLHLLSSRENTTAISKLDFYGIISKIIIIVGVIILFITLFKVLSSIAKVLNQTSQNIIQLADKNFNITTIKYKYNDEISSIIKSLYTLKEELVRGHELEKQKQLEQKQKSLQTELIENKIKDFDSKVSEMLQNVSSAATEMFSTAEQMAGNSKNAITISGTTEVVSSETSNNIQTVSAATEELTASIQEIASQVTKATGISVEAVDEAEKANVVVSSLSQAADEIGQVVEVISEIAEQINLLALNATIESARAGEAGKGFAVVASEVKNLAEQTKKATEQIADKIGNVQDASNEAVEAIGSIKGTIEQINEISTTISSAVEEQRAATSEIAQNVQTAASGVQGLSDNIGKIKIASDATDAGADEVLNASKMLSDESESLNSQIQKFLSDIKNI